jgi:hypothetical protein
MQIYMHCTRAYFNGSAEAPEGLRQCIDQASEVGFEMVILSFGSSIDLESVNASYIESMRKISEYAAAKGVEMGGYDLLAHTRQRGHNASVECIGPHALCTHTHTLYTHTHALHRS